jgi:hypothetical protein
MANIVGEPFDEYVSKQIVDRQKIHGQGFVQNRDNLTLSYLNSKTSWLKLSSGVEIIDQERLKNIGLDYSGFLVSNLAKQFILFGGTYDSTNTFSNKTLHSGILGTPGNNEFSEKNEAIRSILNKVAYGTGGTEFGLRPMPGITSAETKFRNRGSIREGTVNIKAYNRTQLEIIDLLYLRLGFPMLLEWGHSIIVDANGNVDTKPDFSISKEFLSSKYKTDNEVLAALEAKRKESAGNYDGMYGRVINFDWSFNKDGSYDITLKLISVGAVIESLKLNVLTSKKDVITNSANSDEQKTNTTFDWIIKYKNSHDIGNYFFKFWILSTNHQEKLEDIKASVAEQNAIAGLGFKVEKTIKNFFNPQNNFLKTYPSKNGTIEFIKMAGKNGDSVNRYYIRLGHLLDVIRVNIIPISKDNENKPAPLVYINTDSQTNYMYTEEFQISSDPRVCFVGGFKIKRDNNVEEDIFSKELNSVPFKTEVNGVRVGLPMNIFVEFSHILSKIESLKDENGVTTVESFINSILTDINVSLGGLNHLELVIDENNLAKIIDSTPIPGSEKLLDSQIEPPVFNVFGYYENKTSAGFIRDFSLKTEITNNLATMLTIGATANKSTVGEDATAFSKWNRGLEPILNKEINYKNAPKIQPNESVATLTKKLFGDNTQLIEDFYKYLDQYKNISFKEEDLDGNTDMVTNFLAFRKQVFNLTNKLNKKLQPSATSSKGFLPINFSLTMDGLSGIKIYQQIKVDTSFLPSEYPTALKFIIKGVSHKIDSDGWSTSIETVSVPVIEAIEETTSASTTTPSLTTAPAPADRAESRNCGTPATYQISSNPDNTGNIVYKEALNKALQNTFKGGPGQPGLCALYTNSIATSFVNILKGNPPGPQFVRGKGNAKDVSTRNYLKSLGYSVDKWAENISKTEIQKLLNGRKYNIGDILIYWANDGNQDEGLVKYGHIEIYSGKVWNPYTYSKPQTNYVSSVPDNYTTNPFVYGKYNNNCWTVYLCKAPLI